MLLQGPACARPRTPDPRRASIRRSRPALESLELRSLLSAGPLGLNASPEYVNLMNSVRDWSVAPGRSTLTRDANGWPTSDATIAVADDRVNQAWNGPDPAAVAPDLGGTYHLSFNGQATLGTGWAGGWTPQNQVYNAATNTTTADVVASAGDQVLVIDFLNTRNPASATGAGVSNVKLISPGYAANTTQLFTNRFLAALQPFGTLRTLDAEGTNNYPIYGPNNQLYQLNWSQRRLPTDSSQVDSYNGKIGESWEYQIAMANQANTDLWINIPGPATDDYVTQFANLIKNGDTVGGVYLRRS